MQHVALRQHQFRNALQSLLLVLAMALLFGYLAWSLGGVPLAVAAVGAVAVAYLANPAVSPQWVLRLYRGRSLGQSEAPELYALVAELARRAKLPAVPRLYYLPSDVMNAFATGHGDDSAIGVSDGLLRRLSLRELGGVLAHEITHIRNRDLRVMGFADLIGRFTWLLSSAGMVLLFVNLPMVLVTGSGLGWGPILALLVAPTVAGLIQLALSRSREYEADLGAAELTGDPAGLASALARMDRIQGRVLEQILLPGQRIPEPSLLRTHPPITERINRLTSLLEAPGWLASHPREEWRATPAPERLVAPHPFRARWHHSGLWY